MSDWALIVLGLFRMTRSTILNTGFILPVTIFIVSCSNPKEANKVNFERAIQAYLDTDPVCLIRITFGQDLFPVSYKQEDVDIAVKNKGNKEFHSGSLDLQDDIILADLGLLKATQGPVSIRKTGGFYVGPDKQVPATTFTVTDEGTKWRKSTQRTIAGGQPPFFCFGDKKLVKIVNFTEPSNAFGSTSSSVSYTYKVANVAPWAMTDAAKDKFEIIKKAFKTEESGTTQLIKTDAGWMHPALFNNKK